MPRIGMEAHRRKALIDATVETIHARGFPDATMAEIARRAGVSGGLAHHYFGSKAGLLNATMRALLADLSRDLRAQMAKAETARERISATIAASFGPGQFQPALISAWLAFYLQARVEPETRRLLRIYHRRLVSNLAHDFALLMGREEARRAAEGTAAMIDGLWLQRVFSEGPPQPRSAVRMVEDYVERQIVAGGRDRHA
ncbi:transcriptional regulator BetI [Stappia sp. F7233]|uniref:HTH-type transcriptional regulator BetI n=1 Tax=Stappia albiluteola TaxID=2758565 RepID=A0A839AL57_9HYPH|nr:transcriptional regulator BetI [Stappia albiluteola]MBA5779179.1 transcriptional regulator BetI [Stappia albiluteola]